MKGLNTMKKLTKLLSLALAILMVMSLAATAFAADPQTTIKIKNTSAGAKYIFYRLLDLTESADKKHISYTPNSLYRDDLIAVLGLTALEGADEVSDKQIIDAISALKPDNSAQMDVFANSIYARISSKENAGEKTVADGATTVEYTGDYGYYLIAQTETASAPGSASSKILINTGASAGAEIEPKSFSVPTSQKTEGDINDSDTLEDDVTTGQEVADWDIGDKVPYVIYGTVVDNLDAYKLEAPEVGHYWMIFHDEPCEGLSFTTECKNALKVFINHVNETEGGGSEKVDITGQVDIITNTGDNCSFHVKVDLLSLANGKTDSDVAKYTPHHNDKIRVEFPMELNDKAKVGSAGNPNKFCLEYSNKPGTEETGKTKEDIVTVYTYDFVVNKVDQDNKALQGATFKLEKRVKTADGYSLKTVDIQKADELVEETVDGKTVTHYRFKWHGLDAGDYVLTETEAPDGYTKAEPTYFRIEHIFALNDTTKKQYLQNLKITILGSGWDPHGGAENPFADYSNGIISGNAIDDKPIVATVQNKPGTLLPSTGGIGTTLFYVFGSILAIGAGVLLVSKKRMGAVE